MKIVTGLFVGAAMLLSGFAGAQYYPQASVSGYVLSYGPLGFMLQGPDGNYGIVVTPTTIGTDSWNTILVTGAGNVQPGDFVTATGYPTSQWIMQANQIVVRNANPPIVYQPYGSYYGTGLVPGAGIVWPPSTFATLQ
jgi:hypothetical protein